MFIKPRMKSALARNTLWMSCGQGARLAIQAAYFTVIARSLGVGNYGAFVGVVALVGILYPFAAIGRGNILVRSVARDPLSFPRMWGATLATVLICGSIFLVLAASVSRFALPSSVPLRLVLLVGGSDIIGLNVITTAGQAFQALDQLRWTATINAFGSASRLIGALILCSICHAPTPLQWGYVYFVSTALVAIAACRLVSAKLGPPAWNLPHSWREIREGLYFSISLSAQTVYNDIDKTMLARLSTLTATGIYGASYRIIDVSFSPVSALLYAAYPNFFRKGACGVASTLSYARPLLLRSVGYASAITIAILLGAGLVPYILGPQYRQTAEALRWLAPLPIFKAIHYFLSDALSGAGFQNLRCAVQVGIALFNALINLWLVPRYSWRGAAWSSIASDALLAVAIGLCAISLARRERTAAERVAKAAA
jgi:O-antigen/teichoic acid export membrane protein